MRMSDDDLAAELRRRYCDAKDAGEGDVTTTLVLFGIKYADSLHRGNIGYILRCADIGRGPKTIGIGRRLAGRVDITDPEW